MEMSIYPLPRPDRSQNIPETVTPMDEGELGGVDRGGHLAQLAEPRPVLLDTPLILVCEVSLAQDNDRQHTTDQWRRQNGRDRRGNPMTDNPLLGSQMARVAKAQTSQEPICQPVRSRQQYVAEQPQLQGERCDPGDNGGTELTPE